MSNEHNELLALYALGALDGEERERVEAVLAEGDPADAADLQAYEHVAGLLGWSVEPATPPPFLRGRLMSGISEAKASPSPIPFRPRTEAPVPPRSRFGAFAAVATLAAAATIAAVFLGLALYRASGDLESSVRQLADARAAQQKKDEELARANRLLGITKDPAVRLTRLTAAGVQAEPSIDVLWHPEKKSGVLVARSLPSLEPNRTYELWLIDGAAPIPAGTFNTDANGDAVIEIDRLTAAGEPRKFAVTVEPAGGSAAPTTPIILVGDYRRT